MILQDTEHRDTALVSALVAVWERSVRATHTFLTDDEINRIKQYVPQAIAEVPELAVMRPDSDSSDQTPLAFMGVADGRLEMLFVDSDHRGHGVGKQLLEHGIAHHNVSELTVNEQNPQAIGFYQHMGFVTYQRTEQDEEGGPYPLALHASPPVDSPLRRTDSRESFQTFPEYAILARATNSSTVHSHVVSLPQTARIRLCAQKKVLEIYLYVKNRLYGIRLCAETS